jgi:sec-independent protein translocase protein TatB
MLSVMFDIGFGEMVLLAAVALIAIGPKQLPEVARAIGKLIGEFKKTMSEVTTTVANVREETDRTIRKVSEDLSTTINSAQKIPDPPKDHAGDPPWVVDPSLPKPSEDGPSGDKK